VVPRATAVPVAGEVKEVQGQRLGMVVRKAAGRRPIATEAARLRA